MSVDTKRVKALAENLSVLFVEDDSKLREHTQSLLATLFRQVDTASNGKEGFEVFEKNNYDIVISDIYMPEADGITLSRLIRQKHPEQPIIIISAHEESHYLIDLINLGIDHFILKPMDINQFLTVIHKV